MVDYSQLHEKGSRKKRRRGKGLGEDVGTPPSKRARDGEGTSDEGEGDSEDENGKNRGGHVGKKVGNMSAGKRQKGKGRTAKNKRARTSDDEDYDPDDDRDDGHSDSESDNELTEAEREKARRELEEADPDFQVASTPARARDGGTTRKPREGAKRSTLVAEAISIKRKVKQTKLDWNLAKVRPYMMCFDSCGWFDLGRANWVTRRRSEPSTAIHMPHPSHVYVDRCPLQVCASWGELHADSCCCLDRYRATPMIGSTRSEEEQPEKLSS